MLNDEAEEVMKDPGGNAPEYTLRAAACLLMDNEYMAAQSQQERLRLVEAAVGMICFHLTAR